MVHQNFTMDLNGVEYVQMDLMIMLEMLHVDNQDIMNHVKSLVIDSMLTFVSETVY